MSDDISLNVEGVDVELERTQLENGDVEFVAKHCVDYDEDTLIVLKRGDLSTIGELTFSKSGLAKAVEDSEAYRAGYKKALDNVILIQQESKRQSDDKP